MSTKGSFSSALKKGTSRFRNFFPYSSGLMKQHVQKIRQKFDKKSLGTSLNNLSLLRPDLPRQVLKRWLDYHWLGKTDKRVWFYLEWVCSMKLPSLTSQLLGQRLEGGVTWLLHGLRERVYGLSWTARASLSTVAANLFWWKNNSSSWWVIQTDNQNR